MHMRMIGALDADDNRVRIRVRSCKSWKSGCARSDLRYTIVTHLQENSSPERPEIQANMAKKNERKSQRNQIFGTNIVSIQQNDNFENNAYDATICRDAKSSKAHKITKFYYNLDSPLDIRYYGLELSVSSFHY